MIHSETKDDDRAVDSFPILKQHHQTGCIAIFTTTECYIVVDQGNQVGELLGTSHNIISSEQIPHWEAYNGTVKLFNA